LPKLIWAVAFLLTALALQSLGQAQTAPTWNLRIIDAHGEGGSLALDSNGNPHVVFSHWDYSTDTMGRPSTVNRLDYAVWNGSCWNTQTVDSSAQECVLKVDSEGQPHIIYVQGGGSRFFLNYAVLEGGNWSIQTLDSSWGGMHCAMALDSRENPHVVYTAADPTKNENGSSTKEIKYARYNGHNWTTQTIERVNSSVRFTQLALALDSNGNPHVIYLHNVVFRFPSTSVSGYSNLYTYNVKYASLSGSNWQSQTLFTNCTEVSNLVFNSEGQPCFCYENNSYSYNSPNSAYSSNGTIYFAFWNGQQWLSRPLPTYPPSSAKLFLNLDTSGNPQMYFYSQTASNASGLNYAHWEGSNWKIRNLGLTLNSSDAYHETVVDIVFNSDGMPVVAVDQINGHIGTYNLWGNLTLVILEAPLDSVDNGWVIIAAAAVAIAVLAVAAIIFKRKQS
jgi:hypothetical protein